MNADAKTVTPENPKKARQWAPETLATREVGKWVRAVRDRFTRYKNAEAAYAKLEAELKEKAEGKLGALHKKVMNLEVELNDARVNLRAAKGRQDELMPSTDFEA